MENSALLSAILAHSSEGIAFVGPDLTVRTANESYARQMGIPPRKIIGCSVEELLPGLNRPAGTVWRDVRDTEEPWYAKAYAFEFPDQPERGVTYWDTTISPVLGPDGAFQGWLVQHNEVTERLRLERALHDSEERYRSFFENSPDAVLLTSPDGRVISANPAATRMFGMTEEEICRGGRESLMDTSDPRLAFALEERARTGKAVAELTSRRRDGTTFPTEVSSTVFRDSSGEARTAIFIRDITERKRMESDLRMARLTLDSAASPIYWMTADAHFLYVNEAAGNSMGYTVDELLPMTVFEIDPAFPREQWPALWEEMRQARSMTIESAHRRKDGTTFPVEIKLNFMEFGEREILYSFVADITERKRTEEHLAEQAALLREQAELLDLAHILIRSADDRIVTWNSGAASLYGFSREEAIGRVSHDLFQTVFPESQQAVAEALDEAGHWQGELVHTARDGRKVVVASHQVLHRGEDGRPVAILEVNNNITAQKQAEKERERLLEQLRIANGQLVAESERSRELAVRAEANAQRLASIQQVTDA
ncbi:MAG: PAS domain S-box protein, partial [Actinobacteria bacterium]|nr:PAS domain S-box protein [Actinomycetota bacterium]